jgi:hypothetical protein
MLLPFLYYHVAYQALHLAVFEVYSSLRNAASCLQPKQSSDWLESDFVASSEDWIQSIIRNRFQRWVTLV